MSSARPLESIWHDLECGSYVEDLPLWRALAAEQGDPVLDVGAGTGRVTLDLARAGHRVTALDLEPGLLSELARRAAGMDVATVVRDARRFELRERFSLCVVPMQTIQLLDGSAGRHSFLRCARGHLRQGGILAVSIADTLELYEVADGAPAPVPDMRELDGVLYSSQPTAVRSDQEGFVLERRRVTVTAGGERTVARDVIRLHRVDADQLEGEARAAGLRPVRRVQVPATAEYCGSTVVIVSA